MTVDRTIYYRDIGVNQSGLELERIKLLAELDYFRKLATDRGWMLEGIIECINDGEVASLTVGSKTAVMSKHVKPE
jgi:hypothetical protein